MEKLSVADVARLAGKTPRHIRNLCQEGKLPCEKQKISTGVKYLIYPDTEEFRSIVGEDFSIESMEEVPLYEGNLENNEEGSGEGISQELRGFVTELTEKMTDRLVEVAKEAGRVELLTSTILEKQNDVKFYQDEYFRTSHALTETRAQLDALRAENENLKKRVQELETELNERSKPLWQKVFK